MGFNETSAIFLRNKHITGKKIIKKIFENEETKKATK